MNIIIKNLGRQDIQGSGSDVMTTYLVTENDREFIIACMSNQCGRSFRLANREGSLYINRESNKVHCQKVALGGGCGLLIDDEPVEGLSPVALRGLVMAESKGEIREIVLRIEESLKGRHRAMVSMELMTRTVKYNFDQVIDRRGTDSIKWQRYGPDVLPLWVADMDFISPEPVIKTLHQRVNHGIFGYAGPTEELFAVIQERLRRLYDWEVRREHILLVPGVVTGLNLAFQLFAGPGEGVLAQPPVYSHFLTDPVLRGRSVIESPLVRKGKTYEIDFDAFERSITARTKIFVLCNPHNPVGRVFRPDELKRLAHICIRHGILMCADEIHCDLVYPGHQHIPLATLGNEIADRTITFMSPSKSFNLAGLKCSVVIIENPVIREAWVRGSAGLIPHVNIMGLTAALAAYRDGQEWLDQCLTYLSANRDFLGQYLSARMPSITMTSLEGTYLAWLDCRNSGIPENPFRFFLEKGQVALNDGSEFGSNGEGFVRLNFACPRATLARALVLMEHAMEKI